MTAIALPHVPPPDDGLDERLSFSASELADAFSRVVDADAALRAEHLRVAAWVESALAARGVPGRWDRIDLQLLCSRLRDADRRTALSFLVILAAMLGWMAIEGLLPRTHVLARLEDIDDLAPPSRELRDFLAATHHALATVPAH